MVSGPLPDKVWDQAPLQGETFVLIENQFSDTLQVVVDETTTVDDLLALVMAELTLPLTYVNRLGLTFKGRPVYLRTKTLRAEGIPPEATLVLSSSL